MKPEPQVFFLRPINLLCGNASYFIIFLRLIKTPYIISLYLTPDSDTGPFLTI